MHTTTHVHCVYMHGFWMLLFAQIKPHHLCSYFLGFTAEEHLALVTQERSSYSAALEDSKRQVRGTFKSSDGSFSPPSLNCKIPAASNNITVHYSFDFAQQVSV